MLLHLQTMATPTIHILTERQLMAITLLLLLFLYSFLAGEEKEIQKTDN
jgi:hypothetical protein